MGGCDDDSPRMTDPPMIEVVLTAVRYRLVRIRALSSASLKIGKLRARGVEELAVVEIARITARGAT